MDVSGNHYPFYNFQLLTFNRFTRILYTYIIQTSQDVVFKATLFLENITIFFILIEKALKEKNLLLN